MTEEEKSRYSEPEALRDILKRVLSGRKFLLDCGHHATLFHPLGNDITIIASMKHVVLPYGVCEVGADGELKSLSEKPRYDVLVSTGLYVMEPTVLDRVPDGLRMDATDLIDAVRADGRVGVYPIPERSWVDIGQLEELQVALDRMRVM